MGEFQRARSSEQKTLRLDSIYAAASELFEQGDFDSVTMKALAEQSGLKKASLYNYFKTKEEVFMELFLRELDDWIVEFRARCERMRKPNPERVAGLIADLLVERPRFSRLFAIVSNVLERNVSIEKLREFKTEVLTKSGQLVAIFQSVLPHLSTRQIFEFQIQLHAIVAGLWSIAHPTETYKEAIQVDHLRVFEVDFHSTCKKMLARLLNEKPVAVK